MVLVCKTAGHDGDHRPGDHGLVVVGEPLVVADAAAVLEIQATVRSATHLWGRIWKAWAGRLRTMSTRTPRLAAAQAASLPA
jgi:hypothetical protein